MELPTMFGELVLRLSSHPENVATEALHYLLDRNARVWPSIRTYLGRTTLNLPEALSFRTQTRSEELAQPDLIGTDGNGQSVLIVEAKFWAGLTENQPTTYLRGLPPGSPGILLILCPAQRIGTLWEKLVSRTSDDSSLKPGITTRLESGFNYCSVGKDHLMAALSWSQLLGVIRREAEQAHDQGLLSDVTQLQGLCDRMDSQAFLPLLPEHLGADLGMRVQHFADLVDDVVAELVRNHGANTKSLTTGGHQATYGRYFRLSGLAFFFQYSPVLWARYGETPFWLWVKHITKTRWTSPNWIGKGLDRLPAGKYLRVPHSDEANTVGLDVPVGVERDEVLMALVNQVKEVAGAVASVRPSNPN
jgi:hypothetical protein